jgi:uncharacterized protein YegP (UPF0339 family)
MNKKQAVLEYQLTHTHDRSKPQWRFAFKSPEGETLVESPTSFGSKRAAEECFIAMIKSIAANEYQITTAGD